MNIGKMIFAFIRSQYIVHIHAEMVFVYLSCSKCLADYALVNFNEEFRDGNYNCEGCGGMIRVKEKK